MIGACVTSAAESYGVGADLHPTEIAGRDGAVLGAAVGRNSGYRRCNLTEYLRSVNDRLQLFVRQHKQQLSTTILCL